MIGLCIYVYYQWKNISSATKDVTEKNDTCHGDLVHDDKKNKTIEEIPKKNQCELPSKPLASEPLTTSQQLAPVPEQNEELLEEKNETNTVTSDEVKKAPMEKSLTSAKQRRKPKCEITEISN